MSERSFTHLHTHTEFSMLDGAARVGELVAAAVADGQPALGITDHGNMYGVLDFYKACRDRGHRADHRHRGLHGGRVAPRAAGAPGAGRRHGRRRRGWAEALLPPDPAGRDRRGLPQPDEAVLGGLPRGLLLQAPGRLGAARAPSPRPHRHHRVPGRGGAPGVARRERGGGREARRPAAGHLRPRQPVRRDPGPRARRPAPDQPAADRDRPAPRCAAARHQRQPLHPPRGRRVARRSAVRPDRRAARRHQPVQVRGDRALPQDGGRDAPSLSRRARSVRQHAAHRRAGRRAD